MIFYQPGFLTFITGVNILQKAAECRHQGERLSFAQMRVEFIKFKNMCTCIHEKGYSMLIYNKSNDFLVKTLITVAHKRK